MYSISGYIDQDNSGQKEGWWRVKLDHDISKYYRWLYSRGFRSWDLPMNGPHCTFISGEWEPRIITANNLSDYFKEEIVLHYFLPILTHGRSYWMNCVSFDLDHIRSNLGLSIINYSYHITLGTNKRT